jgi:hypothetical protein
MEIEPARAALVDTISGHRSMTLVDTVIVIFLRVDEKR